MANKIFSGLKLKLSGISDTSFSSDGQQIIGISEVIKQCGFTNEIPGLKANLIKVIPAGVQDSVDGIIQDPAGSAVGAPTLIGGGGSGAIYNKFPDLKPIPSIAEGASVFNTSTGPGHRVLHSYSPDYSMKQDKVPSSVSDCNSFLQDLTNAYINAILASQDAVNDDKSPNYQAKKLNFVPLSGNIYAGNFLDNSLNHLHPSYTISAILLAQAYALKNSIPLLDTSLYYYTGISKLPYNAAISTMKTINF